VSSCYSTFPRVSWCYAVSRVRAPRESSGWPYSLEFGISVLYQGPVCLPTHRQMGPYALVNLRLRFYLRRLPQYLPPLLLRRHLPKVVSSVVGFFSASHGSQASLGQPLPSALPLFFPPSQVILSGICLSSWLVSR